MYTVKPGQSRDSRHYSNNQGVHRKLPRPIIYHVGLHQIYLLKTQPHTSTSAKIITKNITKICKSLHSNSCPPTSLEQTIIISLLPPVGLLRQILHPQTHYRIILRSLQRSFTQNRKKCSPTNPIHS